MLKDGIERESLSKQLQEKLTEIDKLKGKLQQQITTENSEEREKVKHRGRKREDYLAEQEEEKDDNKNTQVDFFLIIHNIFYF